jgi:hypothetical protein
MEMPSSATIRDQIQLAQVTTRRPPSRQQHARRDRAKADRLNHCSLENKSIHQRNSNCRQASMLMYAALPVLSEWLIENRLTLCYFYVDDIGGWAYYALFTALYLALVEVGVSDQPIGSKPASLHP